MRQTIANLPSARASHLTSPQWDTAQCHNCADSGCRCCPYAPGVKDQFASVTTIRFNLTTSSNLSVLCMSESVSARYSLYNDYLPYSFKAPVFPGCHSVFFRTLPRYLTLPLRRAPTCHGNGREPDELTEHHRTDSLQRTDLLPFIPFCEVMNKE